MIETKQSVPVRVGIERVWDYVKDIRRWAELMPGLQDCEIVNDDDSRWILKVGVGGLVRTVKVDVHVDLWDGPQRVFFTYQLAGDPVKGEGSYHANAAGPDAIEMTLWLKVEGSGPMAPMWEAMGAPLLPKFALAFAQQLAQGIEAEYGVTQVRAQPSGGQGLLAWLRRLWRALFARGSQ